MEQRRTITRNILHTFVIQIPNYVLTLIAGILVTRLLGPEGKGVFTLMTANIQLLVMFLGLSLPVAIQFFVANKRIEPSRLSTIGLFLLLAGSAIVFVCLFLWPDAQQTLLAPNFDGLFFKTYFFISFFMANFNAMIIGFIQGNFHFKELNHLTLINSILNFVIFTSLYYASHYNFIETGLREVLILSLSIIFINAFVAFLFFRKKLKTKLFSKFTSEDVSNLTAYLVPSYVSILVNFFNYRLTIWQVNYYEGTENLGYFSLALNFAQMMLLVTSSINTVLFPYFAAKENWNDAVKDLSFVLKVNSTIMLMAALSLVLFSGFLIPLFYGDVFSPSINSIKILAVGTFFCSQSQVFGHFLGARNKNWVNTIVYSLAMICVASLGPFLIPKFGIEGAAIASSAAYILMFLSFSFYLKRKYNIGLFGLLKINKADVERLRNILNRSVKK